MTTEKKPRFNLGTADDLFTTQEMRDAENVAKIQELDVKKSTSFLSILTRSSWMLI